MGVKIEEDQAIMLLSYLPEVCEHFVDTMMYGKQTLKMNEVKLALNSKELQRKSEGTTEVIGEGLQLKARSDKRENKKSRGKSRSKSRNPSNKLRCYKCKEGDFKRDCPERKKKDPEKQGEKGDTSVASYGYYSYDILVVSNGDSRQEWVVDSRCSFHMTPNKMWLSYFKKSEWEYGVAWK